MQMNPGSDVFDLSVKKLTIGRMAIIVFEQWSNLTHKDLRPFKWQTAENRLGDTPELLSQQSEGPGKGKIYEVAGAAKLLVLIKARRWVPSPILMP